MGEKGEEGVFHSVVSGDGVGAASDLPQAGGARLILMRPSCPTSWERLRQASGIDILPLAVPVTTFTLEGEKGRQSCLGQAHEDFTLVMV